MHGGWYASGMGALSAGSGLQSGFSSGGLAGGVVPHSQSYHLMVSNHAHFPLFLSSFACCLSHTSLVLNNNYLLEYANRFNDTPLNSGKSLWFQWLFELIAKVLLHTKYIDTYVKCYLFSVQGATWGRDYAWWNNYDTDNLSIQFNEWTQTQIHTLHNTFSTCTNQLTTWKWEKSKQFFFFFVNKTFLWTIQLWKCGI